MRIRPWILVVVTAVAYGLLNALLSGLKLPGAPIIALRPQVVLPMAGGILAGPIGGFIIGAMGNAIGDIASGFGVNYWDWSIANGLIGLIPGLIVPPSRGRIRTLPEFARMLLAVVAANGMGLCFGILVDGLVLGLYGTAEAFLSWYLPAVVTNVIFGLLLLPVVLHFAGRLAMTVETRTSLALTLLLVFVVVAASAAVTAGFSHLLGGSPAGAVEAVARADATLAALRWSGGVMLLVLLPSIGVSIWLTRLITAPLAALTAGAYELEQGKYDLPEMSALALRDDELGVLAKAFDRMSSSVQKREVALQQEISDLRIEIDRENTSKEVSRITETEYFRGLEQKAKELRLRRSVKATSTHGGEKQDT